MRNYQPLPVTKGFAVDPYIKVEELKDEQGRILFRFIRFNLNKQSLKIILRARARGQILCIDRSLLAQLRYCALSEGENQYKGSRLQSGLTFCTYYEWMQSESIVMRSVISPDGDIVHQIRRDCFDYPKRCRAIATAHHWILEQLLNQLGIKATTLLWLIWLSWGLSFLIVAAIVIVYAANVHPFNPLMLTVGVVMWWVMPVALRPLLRLFLPPVRAWAFHQLLSGLLSPNSLKKKIAKGILERFVP